MRLGLTASRAVDALKDLLRPAASRAKVTVTYEPSRDGDPDPGEVVWTWVAYEDDPSQGKDRPVVVIGRDGERLVGVALTTKASSRDDVVEVGRGDWDAEGRVSYAKLDRILPVEPSTMRREGGVLDRRRFDRLVTALRRHHGIVVPTPPRRPAR